MKEMPPTSTAEQNIFQYMDFYAKYPNIRLFTGKKVYVLHEKVREYLQQKTADDEAQKKLHGNFIWKLKKYYGTPFQKEAIGLIHANIKNLNLSDQDKLNYLNYLLSTKVYMRFDLSFFKKLSQTAISTSAQKLQAQHVFYKMKTLLEKKQKNKAEYVEAFQKFEPFLQNFAAQTRAVSYKMLGEFAETYFQAGLQNEYKEISMQPLVELMQHTSALAAAQSPQLFAAEFSQPDTNPKIDKKAAFVLLKAYHAFAAKNEKTTAGNWNLHHALTTMFCDIVQNFDYSAADVKNLRKALGLKNGSGRHQSRLYEMGLTIQRAYNQSHARGMSTRHKTVQDIFKNTNSRWD